MTPAARIAAAIEVLDRIAEGAPAELALTNWARGSRYAGSKDRAAVRDHVFDALRRWRSSARLGGAETGRGRLIGLLRGQGIAPETLFTGEGHAPARLTEADTGPEPFASAAEELDCPDWLWDRLGDSLGAEREPVLAALQTRAPVFLRVNVARIDLPAALARLAEDEIGAQAVEAVPGALEVTGNARRIQQSGAYLDGLVEVQDASSQAACLALAPRRGDRVLDYCAGGGGKALALAALGAEVTAHDIDPRRMADIAPRAARAGVTIPLCPTAKLASAGLFDLVFCDAPCSGSGTWRRTPDAKWRLDAAGLDRLCALQAEVLRDAAPLVAPAGRLAYATCSILAEENAMQVARFLQANPGWRLESQQDWRPGPQGDGFHLSVIRKV